MLREWRSVLLGIFAIVIASCCSMLQPVVISNLVNNVVHWSEKSLMVDVSLLIVLPLFRTGLSACQTFLLIKTGERVTSQLRRDVFASFLDARTEFVDSTNTGEMVQLVNREPGMVGQVYIATNLTNAVSSLVTLISSLAAMLFLSWWLTLVIILFLLLCAVISALGSRRIGQMENSYSNLLNRGAGFLTEVLGNIRTVRLFGGKLSELRTWDAWLKEEYKQWLRTSLARNWSAQGAVAIIQPISLSVVVLVGAFLVRYHESSIGAMVACITYNGVLFGSVGSLLGLRVNTKRLKVSLKRLFDQLDTREEQHGVVTRLTGLDSGTVEFSNLTFRYPNRDVGLAAVNFKINHGQTALIVGTSGSGKSTLIDLITGLYDPQEGCVCVGGSPLTEWDRDELRKLIGIVPQDVVLWNRSLRENLTYGLESVQFDEDRIKSVVQLCGLSGLIAKLPHGLDSNVGPRAVQLSGGERQRVALARALLRNPCILIFDEATASLDAMLTEEVLELILGTQLPQTKIIISHRLSFAHQADVIIVVNADGSVHVGNHESLSSTIDIYRELMEAERRLNRV
ncbi:MAG: ABC transporter ATP-binding protein/permease [Alicyclobacillus sp.]|nr:ABC transporter ATP-binding protein/permease [Alicyclobacillus sp.]